MGGHRKISCPLRYGQYRRLDSGYYYLSDFLFSRHCLVEADKEKDSQYSWCFRRSNREFDRIQSDEEQDCLGRLESLVECW